jgi:hypothetical protein
VTVLPLYCQNQQRMNSQTLTLSDMSAVPRQTDTTAARMNPIYTRMVLLGGTSIAVGILWDISWHRTIGRDTFWTPAHLAIYLGGLLGGLTCGWLVIRTTFFGTAAEKGGAVRIWGFRGPLGAWVTIWGTFAMLTSAPFDNWWHDAYGVDVKILSPPHTILALGMWGVVLGALLLILREQNLVGEDRESEQQTDRQSLRQSLTAKFAGTRLLYIYAAGVQVVMASVFLIEYSWPNQQRTGAFYVVSAATFPMYLMWLARGSKLRWAATWIALMYMGITAAMGWVLPLFPGQPRLGPIYNPVTHFVALPFPFLLVVPAIGIDLIRNWIGQGRGLLRDLAISGLAGLAFLSLFLVTQWFFSAFLISHAAENWFFIVKNHWGYRESLGDWRNKFWSETSPNRQPPLAMTSFLVSLAAAIIASRVGLWLGNWMVKVRR